MKKITLLLPLVLVAGCCGPSELELKTARAEGACEEWADQAPDWNRFNTGYEDIPGSKGWDKFSRRICGSETGNNDVVGREFSMKYINAPCHAGDDCPTPLKDVLVDVKRWDPTAK